MTRRRLLRGIGWTALALGAVLVGAPVVSREVRFVYRGGWELARLQWRARPIADVLTDTTLDAITRASLALTLEARTYAVDALGLEAGDSFTRFADVGRDTLVLVLSASPHDTLAAYTWWFPITGRVPYHGYYSRRTAEQAAGRLRERGLDTYLRPAPAFSTLGWLPDPLLSTSITPGPWIAVTVMHELAHNTVWFPGEVVFSESLASLVGYRGAEAFFRARGDTVSADAMGRAWAQSRATSRIQARLVGDLRVAFADGRAAAERDSLRSAAFAAADSSLAAAGSGGSGALRIAIDEQNNAAVIAAGLYHGDLDGLERLFQACGADIRRVLVAVEGRGDGPCLAVARELVPGNGA